jgi:two-component system, NarL family, nitrate/nitrite response regulator NarL
MISRTTVRARIRTGEHFLREGIVALLKATHYDIVEEDEAGDDDCDLIIVCTDRQNRMPDEADLFDRPASHAKIVVLAHLRDGGPLPRQAMTRAAAILDRGTTAQKLLVALEAVMLGVVVRDPIFFRVGHDVWEAPAGRPDEFGAPVPAALPGPCSFSTREREILASLTEGLPNKVIARRYDIAEATVKVHVKHILRKLNMSNRTQVAIWVKSNAELVA